MAKILNGILGGGSGKVGGVIMSSWKGIDTLKAYAIPSNPQSAGQTTQRNKFSGVLNFLQLILATVIQSYWDPFATAMSGFNRAMSVNLLAWATATAFDDAIVAEGNLEPETIASCTYNDATGDTVLSHSDNQLGNGAPTDSCVIVVVDTANDIAFVSDGITTRTEGGDTIDIGPDRIAANLKAYIFFHRGTGETLIVSNSDYYQVTAV